MPRRLLTTLVRFTPLALLALQVLALIAADPTTAASGGGDFPYRRL
jgi:hypothetical protein